MKIVGCDLHAKQQTIAMVDTDTGEFIERTLSHKGDAVRQFYAALEGRVIMGIEATGGNCCRRRLDRKIWVGFSGASQYGSAQSSPRRDRDGRLKCHREDG